jgi:tRNA(fMet)-specific endonuclease VapC
LKVYFLDTDICVYILNNKYPYLADCLERCDRDCVKIPAIVYYELRYGAEKSRNRKQTMNKLSRFVSEIEIIPFGEEAAELAGKIRADLEQAGQVIGGNDIIIAATAIANGATLVTNNLREFERIDKLSIENWVKNEL